MSTENMYLALRLESPMQSWGYDSQFNRRNTGLWPTKSAIAGMICAASGYKRGSEKEREFLDLFASVKMTAVAIPRIISNPWNKEKTELQLRRLIDYHTVKGTVKASGAQNKNAVITYRQYLTDVSFGVILSGSTLLLKESAANLKNPVWGIWLGRKSCIPASPVFAGLFPDEKEALEKIFSGRSGEFMIQEEVDTFADGKDSISDQAVSFASSSRKYAPRRTKTVKLPVP